MNWYCVCKSQEEGYILTEISQQRVPAGTEFRTCDLPTHIFFDMQPYLPYRTEPFSWIHTAPEIFPWHRSSFWAEGFRGFTVLENLMAARQAGDDKPLQEDSDSEFFFQWNVFWTSRWDYFEALETLLQPLEAEGRGLLLTFRETTFAAFLRHSFCLGSFAKWLNELLEVQNFAWL